MSRRNRIRLVILAIALLFGSPLLPWLQGRLPPPYAIAAHWEWLHRLPINPLSNVLPSLSPFLVLGGLMGGYAAGWTGLLCLLTVLTSLRHGRWFCRHVCPTGLLTEGIGKLRPPGVRQRFKTMPNAGIWLVMLALGSALGGYPLFLWLDPLSIFSGFLGIWRTPILLTSLIPGGGLILILAICGWRPNAWCLRICPLGASQVLISRLNPRRWQWSRDKDVPSAAAAPDRRRFFAIGIGALAALGIRRLPWHQQRLAAVIRPPGTAPEDRFNALCARCGNCLRACPQKIIHAAGIETGLEGFLTPVLRIQPGYCAENCNACNQVCPTAAIRHLSLPRKQNVIIGVARVDKPNCIAWNDAQYCMVCDEYCPYQAIDAVSHAGVNCPQVDPDRCRGCGLCQTVCPGAGPAIRVIGAIPQRQVIPARASSDASSPT